MTIGMLMRKTAPHQVWVRRKPPRRGPTAEPTVATEPQIPIAVLRSRGSKKVWRMSGGHQDCCSGSEECAGADENTNVGCECCNRRCDAENRESDFEHATVPDFVSERPGSEEQASEDKGVGVDDPQALLVARVEFGSKGGKRNVEDRVICSNDE